MLRTIFAHVSQSLEDLRLLIVAVSQQENVHISCIFDHLNVFVQVFSVLALQRLDNIDHCCSLSLHIWSQNICV